MATKIHIWKNDTTTSICGIQADLSKKFALPEDVVDGKFRGEICCSKCLSKNNP